MRNANVVFVTYRLDALPPVVSGVIANSADVLRVPYAASPVRPRPQEPSFSGDAWTRGLYVKTNALLWGLAISNIGFEVDLARHWSFSLPVSYSALNYFTPTIKFRTLSLHPELRYWFDENNRKFFVGAHFGYAQYNVAVGGDYRYQDHSGVSPALGGGVSVGYRMPLSSDGRWHIGFVLGAGAYSLHYDRFYNVPDGRLFDTTRRTYLGIDNASVDISYRFALNRRRR